MDKKELGTRLREARKAKKLTQEALAEIAGIGVMYLGEIERGQKMPSMNIFIKLVNALDVSSDYILRGEIVSGKEYVFDEITKKLEALNPKQRKTVSDLIDAYLKNL